MPATEKPSSQAPLYQRDQYAKGGLGRRYWDFRDRVALSFLDAGHRRIVDMGCGEGITLARLAARFPRAEILGFDILPENVAICQSHGLPARLGDVCAIPLPDASVDAVLLMEVIEHLERPEPALREIRRILRPGGKAVAVFPNDRVFKWARLLTGRFAEAAYDPGHVRQWTPRAIRQALREHGFIVYCLRAIPFAVWGISLHGVAGARKS